MAIFYQNLKKFPKAKAVCILVHGLNNKPEVLNDIVHFLESLSIPVVTVSLTGHHKDFEKLKNIEKDTWKADVQEAYQRFSGEGRKTFLIAYSLGAAVSLDLLSEEIKFDKMILIAPAIAPRKPIKLLKYLAPKFPYFPLYSIVPTSYRANTYLPLKAYDVLFQLIDSLVQKKFSHSNVPTLVVMDPQDETMSLDAIKETIVAYRLNQWRLILLDDNHSTDMVKFHHLIITKEAMGHKNWTVFMEQARGFLKDKP